MERVVKTPTINWVTYQPVSCGVYSNYTSYSSSIVTSHVMLYYKVESWKLEVA